MTVEAGSIHPAASRIDILDWSGRIFDIFGLAAQAGESLHRDHPNWDSSDFRRTLFVKIPVVCQATVFALSFQANCLMLPAWWKDQKMFKIAPSDASADQVCRDTRAFLIFTRCGFTHLIFSQIETTLRAFLRTLAPAAVNRGTGEFKNVYECLLRTHLGVRTNADEESVISRLNFFRVMRNLIHNNGLFLTRQSRDEVIHFQGREFRFTHNQHATIVGWPTLIDLVGALVADMEWVVRRPEIAGQRSPIIDPVLESDPNSIRTADRA